MESDPELYAESLLEVKEILQVASKGWLAEQEGLTKALSLAGLGPKISLKKISSF